MNKPIILITGANGFIGQEICWELTKSEFKIRAAIRKDDSGLSNKYETFVVGDINNQSPWDLTLRDVDTVIHLAARVHIMRENKINSWSEYHTVNVLGTEHLARKAAHSGVRRFIFLSSIKVNGEFTPKTDSGHFTYFTEEDKPEPQDPYGRSKWEAEQMLRKIGQETNMEIVILRAPLVYGPGVKANFLNLMKLINFGIPLPFANIKNKRSLVFIGNLTDIIKNCINNSNIGEDTYLVSDSKDVSTPELMKLVAKAMKRKAMLFPFPIWVLKTLAMLIGKSKYIDRLADSLLVRNDKIVKALNWKPLFSIEEGIEITVNHYLSNK